MGRIKRARQEFEFAYLLAAIIVYVTPGSLVMNHRFITQNDELINHVMNFSFSAKNDVFIMVHKKNKSSSLVINIHYWDFVHKKVHH